MYSINVNLRVSWSLVTIKMAAVSPHSHNVQSLSLSEEYTLLS